MESRPVLLKLEQVGKSYPGANGAPGLDVLRDVSFELAAGETAAIVGPSGSGKSTLLNLIGTLDQPTSGRVLIDGEPVRGRSEEELARIRNGRIGFVFQSHHLLPQCSALENVLIPTLGAAGVDRAAAEVRARKLLDRVGLAGRMRHRPGQLSGGERQRVAVVRALINQPKLILADEPTGALDHRSAVDLMDLLVELNRELNTALVVVTHSPEVAARMQREFHLEDGRLAVTR